MAWKANKPSYRLQTNSVPASQLIKTTATRLILSPDKSKGKYKYVDGNNITYFNSFKEFKYYSNLILRGKHKHVILEKD